MIKAVPYLTNILSGKDNIVTPYEVKLIFIETAS